MYFLQLCESACQRVTQGMVTRENNVYILFTLKHRCRPTSNFVSNVKYDVLNLHRQLYILQT